jgi:hypothetical protein
MVILFLDLRRHKTKLTLSPHSGITDLCSPCGSVFLSDSSYQEVGFTVLCKDLVIRTPSYFGPIGGHLLKDSPVAWSGEEWLADLII